MVGFGHVRMALCMLAGLWKVPVVTESNDYLDYGTPSGSITTMCVCRGPPLAQQGRHLKPDPLRLLAWARAGRKRRARARAYARWHAVYSGRWSIAGHTASY